MTTTPSAADVKVGGERANFERPYVPEDRSDLYQQERLLEELVPVHVARVWARLADATITERDRLTSEMKTLEERLARTRENLGYGSTINSLGEVQSMGGMVDAACGRYTQALEALDTVDRMVGQFLAEMVK